MKSRSRFSSLLTGRLVLSCILLSTLGTVIGCTSMMQAKAKKDAMPKEFSCGEPLPSRPGRVQTEYQMPR